MGSTYEDNRNFSSGIITQQPQCRIPGITASGNLPYPRLPSGSPCFMFQPDTNRVYCCGRSECPACDWMVSLPPTLSPLPSLETSLTPLFRLQSSSPAVPQVYVPCQLVLAYICPRRHNPLTCALKATFFSPAIHT